MQDLDTLLKDAYFAGLIDGDGGVYLIPRRSRNLVEYIPTICVGMTCEKTVLAVKEHFNLGTINIVQPKPPGKKLMYYWKVSHKSAREVAHRIYPYLITKKEETLKIINHLPKKPGGQKGSKRGPYKKKTILELVA